MSDPIETLSYRELQKKAKALGISPFGKKKDQLIAELRTADMQSVTVNDDVTEEVKTTTKKPAAEKRGVYVTLEGSYFVKGVGFKSQRPYRIEVQLTDDPHYVIPPESKLRSVCRFYIAPHYFRSRPEEYEGFNGVRELRVMAVNIYGRDTVSAEPVSRRKSIEQMGIDELIHFCVEEDLKVDLSTVSSISQARAQVSDAFENKKLALHSMDIAAAQKQARYDSEFGDVKEILNFTKA